MPGQGRKPLGQKLHHPMPGVLHEHDPGNSKLDRAPVYLAHLRGGEHGMKRIHMRRTTTIVMSSWSSEEPVHEFTDSMVRAIISDESALAYLITRSFKRSSPNISPYAFSGSQMPSV